MPKRIVVPRIRDMGPAAERQPLSDRHAEGVKGAPCRRSEFCVSFFRSGHILLCGAPQKSEADCVTRPVNHAKSEVHHA
jgi:hypothetical protein